MKNRWLLIVVGLVIAGMGVMFLLGKRKPTVLGGQSAAQLYSQAVSQEAEGDTLLARDTLHKLIEEFPGSRQIADAGKRLEAINMKIIFSSLATPQTKIYEVKPGDSLDKIAKHFNTTVELLKKSNHLSSAVIRPGQKLRVWVEKFSIFVDKSQNLLVLKSGDEVIKTYRVSTGKNNSTPVGNFKITSKLVNPVWFKAGAAVPAESPENVLGSRWMGFDLPGYGIHGTVVPDTLGQQVTEGCVRMANQDVEELFAIVPLGAEVTVVD
ncbi:MAG: L,D-transpeptidase family protein [Candidatus Omnitrophota bacterium]